MTVPGAELVEVDQVDATVTDTETVAKNVATNGRWYCAMVFAINALAFGLGHGKVFGMLAVAAALPVGAACIVDQLGYGQTRAVASVGVYALAAAAAIGFIIALGAL